jgi:hypothetical protein
MSNPTVASFENGWDSAIKTVLKMIEENYGK